MAFLAVFFSGQQASILFGFSSSEQGLAALEFLCANFIPRHYKGCKRGQLFFLALGAAAVHSGKRQEPKHRPKRLLGDFDG